VTVAPIEFNTCDGLTLRGDLYEASDPSAPAVVMSGGFSVVRDMALPRYAEALCAIGITVLCYDHRNLGESDGEPRQEINPWAQSRDMICAIDVLTQDDPERPIGLWGSSYSGGEVMVVASFDERDKAIASLVPFAGLGDTDYVATDERLEAIQRQLEPTGKSLADPGGKIMGPMLVVEEPGLDGKAFLSQPESCEWFLDAGTGPQSRWRNEVTLANAFGSDPQFDPGVCAGHLGSTPLLMVVAAEDRVALAADALSAFDRVTGPKRLVLLDGHHFVPYTDDAFDQASSAVCDFFSENL
jgi:pimeloyl-ACP methyl ester carboxylesterase